MDRFGADVFLPDPTGWTPSRADVRTATRTTEWCCPTRPRVSSTTTEEAVPVVLPNWHYPHIHNDVSPALRERRATEEQITDAGGQPPPDPRHAEAIEMSAGGPLISTQLRRRAVPRTTPRSVGCTVAPVPSSSRRPTGWPSICRWARCRDRVITSPSRCRTPSSSWRRRSRVGSSRGAQAAARPARHRVRRPAGRCGHGP